jgi:CRP-like cAMP-binding protein
MQRGQNVQLDSTAFVTYPELVLAFLKLADALPCEPDCVLFRQGDVPTGLYILHEGQATLSTNSFGGEFAISLQTTAGSLLGLPSVIGREPHQLTAIAHRGSRLSFINSDDFASLIQSDPLLSRKILQVLAEEVQFTRRAVLGEIGTDGSVAVSAN